MEAYHHNPEERYVCYDLVWFGREGNPQGGIFPPPLFYCRAESVRRRSTIFLQVYTFCFRLKKEMSAAGIRAAKQIAIEAAKGVAIVSFISFSSVSSLLLFVFFCLLPPHLLIFCPSLCNLNVYFLFFLLELCRVLLSPLFSR